MIQSLITLDAKANENSDILFVDLNRVALMITIESRFIEHSAYYSGIYTHRAKTGGAGYRLTLIEAVS